MRLKGHTYSDGKHTWDVSDLVAHSMKFPVEDLNVEFLFKRIRDQNLENVWGCKTLWEFLDHAKRWEKADLSYPILLTPNGKVCDGIHRILRARALGHKTIQGIRLESMPDPWASCV